MQENTEDLITSLVGSEKGSATTNIKTTLDDMKTTLQTAISGLVRKLNTKFNSIQAWSMSLVCPEGVCPPTGIVPAVNVPSKRTFVYQNGTEEEYKQALLSWFNQTLADADLTEDEKMVKDYMMSHPEVLSPFLKLIFESLTTMDVLQNIPDHLHDLNTNGQFENKNENEVHIFDIGIESKYNDVCKPKMEH